MFEPWAEISERLRRTLSVKNILKSTICDPKTKAGDPLESPARRMNIGFDYFGCFSSCSLINNSARSGTTSHAISRITLSDIISTTRRAMTSIISGVS
jgi:hypothetical protein